MEVVFYICIALVMVLSWPIWMLIARFKSVWTSAIASPEKKFNIKEKLNEDVIASARAHIIEVAIESSFQPLLQLYLLLPILLMQFSCPTNDFLAMISLANVYSSPYRIQFWSIVTSIISLSWSFTYYQAVQKKGALDFTSNPFGRLTLLFSNICQITSRLFALTLYAYIFKNGNFWPMILSVMIHLLLMSYLHFRNSNEWESDVFKKKGFKIAYHCLINGICNLYLHNWIGPINQQESDRGKSTIKKGDTSFRQILFDLIFILENFAMVVWARIVLREYLHIGLFVFVLFSQYLGIGLKWLYYYKFHIWKNTFTSEKLFRQLKMPFQTNCSSSNKLEHCSSSNTLEQLEHCSSSLNPETNNQILQWL